MKYYLSLFILFFSFSVYSNQVCQKYDWAVVGAGPAGILTVALLIDHQIPASSIAWVDPEFKVGAFGKYYQDVPGNLSTKQWMAVFDGCDHLKKCPFNVMGYFNSMDPEAFYPLSFIAYPLEEITDWLLTETHGFKEKVNEMRYEDDNWCLSLDNSQIKARKVVLATGSRPKSLKYPGPQEIPLNIALDKSKLSQYVNPEDTIGVVGSAHSAVIAIMFLNEIGVKHIINLYKHPFDYIIQSEKGPINVETGLKGYAAQFAREIIEKQGIPNLTRVLNMDSQDEILKQCTKVIYAIGFEQEIMPWNKGKAIEYNDVTGVIGKNLFGIGIAFPEKKADGANKLEHRVGMPHFLTYGKRVIKEWIKL